MVSCYFCGMLVAMEYFCQTCLAFICHDCQDINPTDHIVEWQGEVDE